MTRLAAAAALLCLGAACRVACAQESVQPATAASSPPDEVVVIGRPDELRRRVEAAELAVFDRFNEIDSDDRFDIHCREQTRYFSHIKERVCASNAWREQEENYAQATLHSVRGEAAPPPQMFRAEQAVMNQRLADEMRRLMKEDPQLRDAMMRLAEARAALAQGVGGADKDTAFREVAPENGRLPFDAQRMFWVRIGRAPWNHALTEPTFTIGQVSGEVRGLRLTCAKLRKRIDFQAGVDWTVPADSGACQLRVDAAPETTFALYEFE